MVCGDPYRFAVIAERVPRWNHHDRDDPFQNGVLLLCLKGRLFPRGQTIINATLSHELPVLAGQLAGLPADPAIFEMERKAAFAQLYSRVYPADPERDNDYRFLLSPDCFVDKNCLVFGVSDGQTARIFAARPPYCREESVHLLEKVRIMECTVPVEELHRIARALGKRKR